MEGGPTLKGDVVGTVYSYLEVPFKEVLSLRVMVSGWVCRSTSNCFLFPYRR